MVWVLDLPSITGDILSIAPEKDFPGYESTSNNCGILTNKPSISQSCYESSNNYSSNYSSNCQGCLLNNDCLLNKNDLLNL